MDLQCNEFRRVGVNLSICITDTQKINHIVGRHRLLTRTRLALLLLEVFQSTSNFALIQWLLITRFQRCWSLTKDYGLLSSLIFVKFFMPPKLMSVESVTSFVCDKAPRQSEQVPQSK